MKRPLNLIETERRILNAAPGEIDTSPLPVIQLPVSRTVLRNRALPRLTGLMECIHSILERKGQVILYGPLGTGKTYWAERTACELAARSRFNTTFEPLADEEKATILGDGTAFYGNEC
jgi:5-methylcytosine-specific restriction enzyme B